MAALIACGESTTEPVGSSYLAKQLVTASSGGTVAASGDVPSAFLGTRIEIPADALAADTIITIAPSVTDIVEDDATAAGAAIAFGPSGTQFSVPARIVLPYHGGVAPELIRIYVLEDDGTRSMILPENIVRDEDAGTLSFEVSHFTRFQGGAAGTPCAGVTCPQGQVCQNGQCTQGCGGGVGCMCTSASDCNTRLVCTNGACANPPPCTAVGCACTALGSCAAGLICDMGVCAMPPPAPVCGNGTVEANEQCDDGNTANGDGCDSMCNIEMPGCMVTVMSNPLPAGTVNQRYLAQLLSSGALGAAATWSMVSGALPGGLSLDSATGQIIGVPTAAGNFPFVVRASIPNCADGTGQFLITVQ